MVKKKGDTSIQQMEIVEEFLPKDPLIQEAEQAVVTEGKSYTQFELAKIINDLLGSIRERDKQTFIDDRTDYPNLAAFTAGLKNIVKNNLEKIEKGEEPEQVTVVMLDLNYLKTINNFSQQGCGDAAIKYLSKYISQNLRTNARINDKTNEKEEPDLIAHIPKKDKLPRNHLFSRYSAGDEFAIIMRNCSKEQAEARIQEMLNQMAHDSLHGKDKCEGIDDAGRKIPIQVSAAFGCAEIMKIPSGIMSHRDVNKDVLTKKIIQLALDEANKLEAINKEQSKIYASKVPDGNPPVLGRQNAEEIVGNHIEKLARRYNEGRKYKTIPEDLPKDFSAGQRIVKLPNSPDNLLAGVTDSTSLSQHLSKITNQYSPAT